MYRPLIMKIFELHFNPKNKEEAIFDSFCYQPKNIYEQRLGNLYIVGKLSNFLPQNARFLNNLAEFLKKEYYSKSSHSPEQCLKETLKKGNGFLSEISKQGDVSWLGNLEFAVLNVKDFVLGFTKVGNIKILIARTTAGEHSKTRAEKSSTKKDVNKSCLPEIELLDISQNLEFQDIEPYPLKIFGNIAVGKLTSYDKILVVTRKVFDFFVKENLLRKLASASSEKELKEFLKSQKETLKEASGICLLIFLEPGAEPSKFRSFSGPIIFEKEISGPAKIMFANCRNLICGAGFFAADLAKKISGKLNITERISVSPRLNRLKIFLTGKNFRLILSLILLLVAGFFLFRNK